MIAVPVPTYFAGITTSVADGTQPSSTYGTAITPGNNTYGSFVELIGSVAGRTLDSDAYAIEVLFHEGYVNGAARDTIATVGIDHSGGTSYTSRSIDHLLVSCAGRWIGSNNTGYVSYWFPLYIRAGSSIAVKASVNNATVGSIYCFMRLWTKPSGPVRAGQFVRTFGAVTGSSRGTLITPGTTSEGAWASLGTTSDRLWYWEVGSGCNDATMQNLGLFVDVGIGDASNKHIPIRNASFRHFNAEHIAKDSPCGAYYAAASGVTVYARGQASTTPNDEISVIAYGVGG